MPPITIHRQRIEEPMNKAIATVIASLLLLGVYACNAAPHTSGEPPAIPTSASPFTPLPPPSASSTITLTPSPTRTGTSTATATATPTPSRTLKPGETYMIATAHAMVKTHDYWMLTEVPSTLQARQVHCKDGFVLELKLDILRQSSDQWTLFTCSPELEDSSSWRTPGAVDFGTRYTQVTRNDLSQTWIIRHGDYHGLVIDRPDALLYPYRWTRDGKYVYLYPGFYPGPDGFATSAYFVNFDAYQVLYRLNLETGDLEKILPRRDGVYYALSLSPDDQFLIYTDTSEPGLLHVLNMLDGSARHITLDAGAFVTGRFAWRSDSAKVVFASGYEKVGDDWNDNVSAASIYALSVKTMHAQLILSKDPRILVPDFECKPLSGCSAWLDENTIYLYPLSSEFACSDARFTLNIQTGYLAALPTSTPQPETTSTPQP
ncbi:MAG: hypothetical protein AB1894_27215 [Chloroflexota bacterium]